MGRFTKIPENTFSALQLDAGLLLTTFNPTTPNVQDANIITATTGGINVVCQPSFSDLGEDVDNCPVNMKELKKLESWTCTISFTAIGTSPELIKLSLGCADITAATSKIVPRANLDQTDFADLWWVGDRADGGFVAICLKNALSTDGFSLQTTKNGKGQISCTITGHVSINAQDVVPMEFYSTEQEATPGILLNKHTLNISVGEDATLTVSKVPSSASVTWTSGTTAKATVSNGTVHGVAAGSSIITASITVNGVAYNDTCTVVVS